jgi:hypothetical protein
MEDLEINEQRDISLSIQIGNKNKIEKEIQSVNYNN